MRVCTKKIKNKNNNHNNTQWPTEEKIKQSEKRHKNFNLARKLRKLLNMMVTVKPIVIGTLGTLPKGLGKLKIGRQIETIQLLLRSVRIQ